MKNTHKKRSNDATFQLSLELFEHNRELIHGKENVKVVRPPGQRPEEKSHTVGHLFPKSEQFFNK